MFFIRFSAYYAWSDFPR